MVHWLALAVLELVEWCGNGVAVQLMVLAVPVPGCGACGNCVMSLLRMEIRQMKILCLT